MTELLHLPLRHDRDIVRVRQCAREAAALLGLPPQDQTRWATAVSEVARATCITGGGSALLSVEDTSDSEGVLTINLRQNHHATALDEVEALGIVARLVDGFDRDDTGLVMTKRLPPTRPAHAASAEAVREQLHRRTAHDSLTVLRDENVALVQTLALLHERESELVRINEELAETNRGVLALYVELENSAQKVRTAQREVFTELEDALRPPPPAVPGVELGVRYIPAQTNSPTGGDLYDWLVLPDGRLHISVVDVTGHGVESTRAALDVTHALRTLSREGHPLGSLIALADRLLADTDAVATVLLARFDPCTGQVELAGGGHPPALLLAGTQPATYQEAPGRPVGYPMAGSDGITTVTLHRDDTLILYTDGMVEAGHDIVAGLEVLRTSAQQWRAAPLETLLDGVLGIVRGGADLSDDALVLALRRTATGNCTHGAHVPVGTTSAEDVTAVTSSVTFPTPAPTLLLDDTPASARTARTHTTAVCLAWDVPESVRHDAEVVVSELVTNAAVHVGGTVGVSLMQRPDGLRIEVTDGSPRTPYAADPGQDAEGGRGLLIVHALAETWGCTADADSKTIWVHLAG